MVSPEAGRTRVLGDAIACNLAEQRGDVAACREGEREVVTQNLMSSE